MPNLNTARYTGDEEMPDLSKHNNWMAKVMTPEMYKRMRARQTKSGFTIDDVIQTGVDNPGTFLIKFTGSSRSLNGIHTLLSHSILARIRLVLKMARTTYAIY